MIGRLRAIRLRRAATAAREQLKVKKLKDMTRMSRLRSRRSAERDGQGGELTDADEVAAIHGPEDLEDVLPPQPILLSKALGVLLGFVLLVATIAMLAAMFLPQQTGLAPEPSQAGGNSGSFTGISSKLSNFSFKKI